MGITFFFAWFDIGNIGTALPRVVEEFGVSKEAGATVVSLGLGGYIAGGLVGSVLADRFGRRVGFLFAVLFYGIGSLVNGLSGNIEVFSVFRFVSGMGIGAALGVVSTYMSEIAPAKGRGRYMAWTTLPALCGYAVVPILSLWLVPHVEIGWRLLLIVPMVGTVVFLSGFHLLPESPRWLASRGRMEEANRIVTAAEERAARLTGRSLAPVAAPAATSGKEGRSFLVVFSRKVLPWTILFFVLWTLNYIPIYGVGGMGVTLMTDHGVPLGKSIELTLGSSAGIILGGLVAPWVADRMPRKWPAFGVCLVLGTTLILLGFFPTNTMLAITFFVLGFQVGIFAPLVYLLTAEHFPTSGRATGIALCNAVGHVGGAIAPILIVAVDASFGFGATWSMLGILVFALAAGLLLTRNTTGVSLESTTAESGPITAAPLAAN
ncbi:MFS transporter [Streptomyces sp. NPDC050743]|uniref:MFS transporter n=1 Tax=Streptomyces sp. NPDC050743 TaxID=3365634 RepID=UPI0037942A8B